MDISVIVPFYNTGQYINDTIESIISYKGPLEYEIIIIDDGSDDAESINKLNQLTTQYTDKIVLLHQSNKGANAARNYGCKIAQGEFLFFLDSDNKMYGSYWDEAMKIFKKNAQIGIVYSKPIFFGDQSRPGFETGPFDIDRILDGNYIDMCSIVRVEAYKSVEGLDENKHLNRLQDWEFWLNLYKHGWQFYYISQPQYEYRIRKDSIGGKGLSQPDDRPEWYIRRKHVDILLKRFKKLINKKEELNQSLEDKEQILKRKSEILQEKEQQLNIIKHSIFLKWCIKLRNLFAKKTKIQL